MVDCRKCQRFSACYFDGDDCIGFVPKTMTNADRIRSMTDEKLAEYLFERGNEEEYCYGICAYQDECHTIQSRKFCLQQIVKWLKEVTK